MDLPIGPWLPVLSLNARSISATGHKVKVGHHTIDRLEEREARKEEALDDLPVKGRERAIVHETNTGTVSKATFGQASESTDGAHIMGFSERIDTILNCTYKPVTCQLPQGSYQGGTHKFITQQRWEKLLSGKGWSAYGLFRARTYHLELN